MTFDCDLNLELACVSYAHRLTEMNNILKYNANLSKGSGDMEWTRKCYR